MYNYVIKSKKPLDKKRIEEVAKIEGEDVGAEEIHIEEKVLTGPKWKRKNKD